MRILNLIPAFLACLSTTEGATIVSANRRVTAFSTGYNLTTPPNFQNQTVTTTITRHSATQSNTLVGAWNNISAASQADYLGRGRALLSASDFTGNVISFSMNARAGDGNTDSSSPNTLVVSPFEQYLGSFAETRNEPIGPVHSVRTNRSDSRCHLRSGWAI